MALTTTLLASGQDGWNTATDAGFTSASITPGASCALILLIGGIDGSALGDEDLFTTGHTVVSSGSGPTWTKQDHTDTAATFVCHAAIWTATVTTDPGSFTVTADFPGTSRAGAYAYSIHRSTGHDTATPFGGLETTTDQAGDGAVTITLTAAPATDDATIALDIADVSTGSGGATFGAGTWTETGDGTGSGADVSWNTGYRTGSTSTSVPWSDVNTGSGDFSSAQAAIVVKAAAGTDISTTGALYAGPDLRTVVIRDATIVAALPTGSPPYAPASHETSLAGSLRTATIPTAAVTHETPTAGLLAPGGGLWATVRHDAAISAILPAAATLAGIISSPSDISITGLLVLAAGTAGDVAHSTDVTGSLWVAAVGYAPAAKAAAIAAVLAVGSTGYAAVTRSTPIVAVLAAGSGVDADTLHVVQVVALLPVGAFPLETGLIIPPDVNPVTLTLADSGHTITVRAHSGITVKADSTTTTVKPSTTATVR